MEGWIPSFLERTGYLGVWLLMVVENVFPPIPSEVVMPCSGFLAASGQMHLLGVVAAGVLGTLLGTLPWYGLGRWLGRRRLERFAARHGRWLTLQPDDVDKVMDWFSRHGRWAILFGRLVPGVRTLISLPAGTCGMPLPKFLAYTALGSALWTGLLAGAGFWLGQEWSSVERWLGPVSNGVLLLAFVAYLYRVVRFEPRSTT